nr:amylo-alpha-1,6-glucosidase [Paenibacillus macerans]
MDQVTLMDVRVGDWAVTPRHGKPVEINALWYNALCIMARLAERFGETEPYDELARKVRDSFRRRFWNEAAVCLYDVSTFCGRRAARAITAPSGRIKSARFRCRSRCCHQSRKRLSWSRYTSICTRLTGCIRKPGVRGKYLRAYTEEVFPHLRNMRGKE